MSDNTSTKHLSIFKTIMALIVVLVFAGAMTVSALWLYYQNTLQAVPESGAPYETFTVVSGQSVSGIANILSSRDLIKNPLVFRVAAKLQRKDTTIQAGDYQLSRSMSMQQVLDALQQAEIKQLRLTILPGSRMEDVAELVESQGLVAAEDFITAAQDANYAYPFLGRELPFGKPEGSSLEGYLFPDTYLLPENPDVDDIVIRVLNNFADKYEAEIASRLGEQSLFEVLILASIVEREAHLADDQKMIAGIYQNRLELGMTLGADPTVLYALGSWDAVLDSQTLQIDSPYNTRKYAGLTPGPICSPGLSAILAVLEPTESDYLYFLTDRNGTMRYAKTNAEHNANKLQYGVSGL